MTIASPASVSLDKHIKIHECSSLCTTYFDALCGGIRSRKCPILEEAEKQQNVIYADYNIISSSKLDVETKKKDNS